MDPVSLVVGALAAGVSSTVTDAVRDAYAGLRDAVVRRLRHDRGNDSGAEREVQALEAQAASSGGDLQPLHAAVTTAGLATDELVLAAAARVLAVADPAGARVGKYVVDLRGATGVQVGDGTVHVDTNQGGAVGTFNAAVTFNAAPSGPPAGPAAG